VDYIAGFKPEYSCYQIKPRYAVSTHIWLMQRDNQIINLRTPDLIMEIQGLKKIARKLTLTLAP
jgi:hypothetical protein